MTFTLKVVFGKEQVDKVYSNLQLTDEETEVYVKEYWFNSEVEKQAFIKGLHEAVGYLDFCIPDLELV